MAAGRLLAIARALARGSRRRDGDGFHGVGGCSWLSTVVAAVVTAGGGAVVVCVSGAALEAELVRADLGRHKACRAAARSSEVRGGASSLVVRWLARRLVACSLRQRPRMGKFCGARSARPAVIGRPVGLRWWRRSLLALGWWLSGGSGRGIAGRLLGLCSEVMRCPLRFVSDLLDWSAGASADGALVSSH